MGSSSTPSPLTITINGEEAADDDDVSPDLSPNPAMSVTTQVSLMCLLCNKPVVKKIGLNVCSVCGRNYHPSCVHKTTILPDGRYMICCGMDVRKISSPKMIISDQERNKLMDDIRETVTQTIKVQMQAVAAEVVKDIRKELSQEFEEIRQSIDEIKSSADTQRAENQEEIEAVRAKITEVETQAASRVNKVTKKLDSVVSSVKEVKKMVSESQLGSTDGAGVPSLTQCLTEVEDRLSRKQNVMVLGVPESEGLDAVHRKLHDKNHVERVFNGLLSAVSSSDVITCLRVGKYSPNLLHARPLKGVMSSAELASSLIRISRQKKRKPEYQAVLKDWRIYPDRTELQRQQEKLLQEELGRKRGELNGQDLRIMTINGTPRIISSGPRKDHHQDHRPVSRQV